MPALVAAADHVGRAADGRSDEAVVDEPAAGLDARAQEGVRRAAQHQSLFLGDAAQFDALGQLRAQRLFRIDVLARQQRRTADLEVLVGARQVQHDLHLRIGEGVVHGVVDFGHAVLGGGLLGALAHEIAHADELQLPEGLGDVLQINSADIAHADHGDPDSVHGSPPHYIWAVFSNRSVVRLCFFA